MEASIKTQRDGLWRASGLVNTWRLGQSGVLGVGVQVTHYLWVDGVRIELNCRTQQALGEWLGDAEEMTPQLGIGTRTPSSDKKTYQWLSGTGDGTGRGLAERTPEGHFMVLDLDGSYTDLSKLGELFD